MALNFTAADRVGGIGGYIGGIATLLGMAGNGGILNGCAGSEGDHVVNRYEAGQAAEIAALKSDIKLRDANTYAELAMEYREADLETAELFYKLSGEEVGHMEALHRAAVRLIEKYRREKGEPPADMMAVYEYLHKRAVRKGEEVGILQAMFKK